MAEVEEIDEFQCGSEEVHAHICMVCKEDELFRKAEGYCKKCKEFLCTNCIRHHRSVRITKSHEIIEVTDDMEEIVGQFADSTIEEDVCPDHRKAPIEMFCKDHDEVGCHHCMTLKHNKCEKESIDTSILTFNEAFLSSKMTDLDRIISGLSKAAINNMKSDDKAIKEYKVYLDKQNAQKRTLVNQIDMAHMKDGAFKVSLLNEYLSNSKMKKKSIADTTKTVETLIHQSTEIQQSTSTKQKFITFNKLSKQIPLLEIALDDASAIDIPFVIDKMAVEDIHLYKHMADDRSVVDFFNNTHERDLKKPFQYIRLDAPQGQDTMVKNGVTTNISTKHQCLTAMKQFEGKSLEELRHEWYTEFRYLNDHIPTSLVKLTKERMFGLRKDSYKLLLVGDWGVGKSTFIKRNIAGNISKVFKESMGVNVFPITLDTTADQLCFDVWDTCGQERLSELRDGFYKDGQCAIIMFDVSSPTSVSSVSKWYARIQQQCGYIPVVVCGNKVDLASKSVKNTNIAKLNKLKLPLLKVQLISGKTMTNFEAPFIVLGRALTSNYSMEIRTKCSLYPVLQTGLDSKVLLQANGNDDDDL